MNQLECQAGPDIIRKGLPIVIKGSNRNIARKPQAKRYANGGNDEKPLFHTTNLQNPLQKVKQTAQKFTEFRWRCKYKYSLDSG